MKRISLVTTLVAVAFIGVMAIGSASASATVLCKTSPADHKCGSENVYPTFTEIYAELAPETKAKVTTLGGSVRGSCSQSEMVFGPTEYYTFFASMYFPEVSFASCDDKKLITTVETGWGVAEWIEGTHNGEITEELAVKVSMPPIYGKIDCIYYVEGAAELVGGATPTLVYDKALAYRSSGSSEICSKETHFTATYNITTPTPLYVEKN